MNRAGFEAAVGRPVGSRSAFRASLADALDGGEGWAAGKLGGSERAYLDHRRMRAEADPLRRRAFEQVLAFKACDIHGVFPTDPAFLERWTAAFAAAADALDWLGVFATDLPETARALRDHGRAARLVDQRDQQYDRSSPADEARCWLPLLRGRRVLLVCPFASLLAERARRETFEAVWAKTGRRWFEPAAVEALDFPYGIEPATRARYPDCLALRDEIAAALDEREFDVALIAAGALGIPLAAHVKATGRAGFSLGGPLQVLFGVHGERWLAMAHWRERFINDAWIRVPERYAPSARARAPVAARRDDESYW